MIDTKFTERMQSWLNMEPAQRNLEEGALMVLQLNHNRVLYNNIMRRPEKFAAKIEYELQKHLRYRLDKLTMDDVVKMEKELMPRTEKMIHQESAIIEADADITRTAQIAKGKRADHDSLPEEIRRKWETNGPIYFKIKNLFEKLKGMEHAQPCDRYEYLKQLAELDREYHRNLQDYDAYKAGDEIPSAKSADDPAEMVKKVSAARCYISTNKVKLRQLIDTADETDRYQELLPKVQERVDFLLTTGNDISEEQLEELRHLGIRC